jgi:hypothetical protein
LGIIFKKLQAEDKRIRPEFHLWKKGFGIISNWIECSFILLLLLGFALGKLISNQLLGYFIIIAVAIIGGRLVYLKRENDPLPFEAICVAFLLGFVFGNRNGNNFRIIILFVAMFFLSYYAHKKIELLN